MRHQTIGIRPEISNNIRFKYPGGSGPTLLGGFQSGVATSRQAFLFTSKATPDAHRNHNTARAPIQGAPNYPKANRPPRGFQAINTPPT